MLNLLNWRTILWITLRVFLIVGSFLPQTGGWSLASWWNEQQDTGSARWRVMRQAAFCPRWWPRVQWVFSWVRVLTVLSASLWLLTSQLPIPSWAWLYLVIILPIAVTDGRRALSGLLHTKVSAKVKPVPPQSHVEVTIDLEPILAEIEEFSPIGEVYATDREALTAKFEQIRTECFQHPVSRALMEQIGGQVQQVIVRTIEEALVQEMKEHLSPVLGRPSSLSPVLVVQDKCRRIKDTGQVLWSSAQSQSGSAFDRCG